MTGETDGIALHCEQLTRRFGRLSVLRGVTLSVKAGECVALFGRNGAGKSTLLNIAATTTRSFGGTMHVLDTDVRHAGAETRKRIGVVSHESFLYADLSVSENLAFFADLYGIGSGRERVTEVIEQFHLSDKAKAPVRTLSRGMKQRVSLARATLHRPDMLLLDEPFTGLDERSCTAAGEAIAATTARGGAVLLATHDVDYGLDAADRAVVLDRGVIAHEASGDAMNTERFRVAYREVTA